MWKWCSLSLALALWGPTAALAESAASGPTDGSAVGAERPGAEGAERPGAEGAERPGEVAEVDAPTTAPGEPPAEVDPSEQLELPPTVPGRRLVVLQVAASAAVLPELRRRVERAVIEGFDSQDIHVLESETVARTLAPLGRPLARSCRAGHCVSWILDVLAADAGLVIHITAAQSSYTLTLSLLGPYGERLSQQTQSCAICTIDEFLARVVESTASQAQRVPRRVPSGRVGVYPDPPDAQVQVDGVSLGPGPFHLPLTQGLHVIEASREGYAPLRQMVDVQPEQLRLVDMELSTQRRPAKPMSRRRNPRPFFWVSLATGLGAATLGAVFVGMHTQRDGVADPGPAFGIAGASLLSGGLVAALVSAAALFLSGSPARTEAPAADSN